jgi:signal transduction histidine kinase
MSRSNPVPNLRVSPLSRGLDPTSLQFRLMASTIGIGAIALLTYQGFSHSEVQMLVMMRPEQLTSAQLVTLAHRLTTLSLLSMGVMIGAGVAAIGWSLQPLRRFQRWVESNPPPEADRFNARRAPSELRVLAQRWDQLLAQQATVNQQQRQFINNVAHELRSPLSLVHGYLQQTLKRSQNLPDVQRESLAMATAEAERMTLIFQDLIDLARAESLDVTQLQEPVILNEFVRDIATLAEKFDHRSIEIKLPPFPVRVQTHRDYLMQVIDHLIQNALRHSEPDTAIVIELYQTQNAAIIQVCDRGEGISLSQQALVFEPFHRIDPSRTRATGGTGLGLAIVKTLIEKMGGTIVLSSRPGEGTTFTLTLPILGN